MPQNISAKDQEALLAKWDAAAAERAKIIAQQNRIPDKPSLTLTYKLLKFGHHWVGYTVDKKGKLIPLMPAPSLFTSAVDAIGDRMVEDATKL